MCIFNYGTLSIYNLPAVYFIFASKIGPKEVSVIHSVDLDLIVHEEQSGLG